MNFIRDGCIRSTNYLCSFVAAAMDLESLFIKPLTNSSDYHRYKARVKSFRTGKNCEKVLVETARTNDYEDTKMKERLTCSIIIVALSDAPLRIVYTAEGDPVKMLAKLHTRFDSKIVASKITKMTNLIKKRCSSINFDI